MTPSGRELGVCPYFLSQGVGGGGPAGQHGGPPGSRRCPRRGSHSCHLQDQDRHLRDTSEPGGPHVGQLPDLAAVRGGQTLHRLLQHQQCQVPAVTRAPPQRQGEAREGVSVLWEPGEAACRGPGYLRPELGLILPPWGLGPLGTESADSTRDCPRCAGDRPGARGQLPLSRRLLEVVFLPAHLAARGEERPGDPRGGRTLRSALPDGRCSGLAPASGRECRLPCISAFYGLLMMPQWSCHPAGTQAGHGGGGRQPPVLGRVRAPGGPAAPGGVSGLWV